MGKIIELWPGREPQAMSGRDYLAMLIEDEKAYRAQRERYGINHRREIPVPLELAEALLALADEHGVT